MIALIELVKLGGIVEIERRVQSLSLILLEVTRTTKTRWKNVDHSNPCKIGHGKHSLCTKLVDFVVVEV